jgi:hypothetical protein
LSFGNGDGIFANLDDAIVTIFLTNGSIRFASQGLSDEKGLSDEGGIVTTILTLAIDECGIFLFGTKGALNLTTATG